MPERKKKGVGIFLIGGSAGSLKILLGLMPALRTDISFPIVIVIHRKADPDSELDRLLGQHTSLDVVEIEDKMVLEKGKVYIAPADYHVLFEKENEVSLDYSEKVNYSRPSIDVVFQTAAEAYGSRTVGLLLSGGNADGVDGLHCINQQKGTVWVQDPDTAEIDFMPREAIKRVRVDRIIRPDELYSLVEELNNETEM